MFGLNEMATLYRYNGQSGGKPSYAPTGTRFACRSQPTCVHSPSNGSIERTADLRIFAHVIAPSPGDRITIDNSAYIITEVQSMRGFSGVHHVEILARRDSE